ncbi:ribosome maturation factor RimM [Egbenema bharatensis]|uniref:ribosome maturation factor RimM n=1 Tax=Egbenema bharatensis TaxID=3463334 RepID=UPI003A89B601
MWLEIGKIVGGQGLKGEMRVYPSSDFPERFLEPGQRWLLHPGAEEPEPIELLAGRYLQGKGLYVVQLAGITDRNQAEGLRNCRLMVPESDRPPLEEDEFHVLDLVGLVVFDQATQSRIGVVVDVLSAGNDLLEVKLDRMAEPDLDQVPAEGRNRKAKAKSSQTVLIPFVKPIVPVVDLVEQRIEITPPEGLIEGG